MSVLTIRCSVCGRKWGVISGHGDVNVDIKCPKCGVCTCQRFTEAADNRKPLQ